jgi:hypothetical protein
LADPKDLICGSKRSIVRYAECSRYGANNIHIPEDLLSEMRAAQAQGKTADDLVAGAGRWAPASQVRPPYRT